MNKNLQSKVLISPFANQTFELYRMGKVHSIFPHGFNLIFGDNRLLFVNSIGDYSLSSHGMSLPNEDFHKIREVIQKGELVKIQDHYLRFFSRKQVLTVQIDSKQVIDLSIPPYHFSDLQVNDLLERIDQDLVLNHSGFHMDKKLFEKLNEIWESNMLTQESISFLIGRGAGLTPSGDDFLQGYLMMEKAFESLDTNTTQMVQHALKERSTTQVSLSYYHALFENYTNQFFLLFLKSIKDKNQDDLAFFLTNIKHYGKTSGMDTMLGILTYLKFQKDR